MSLPPPPAQALRLLSYNVRGLRDDVTAVDRVLRATRPDLVCVQEAPRFLRWRHAVSELARRNELAWVAGGRASGANVLLVSMHAEVLETRELLLPKRRGLHQRGAVVAVVRRVGAAPFVVAGVHFSLAADERRAHLDPLWRQLAAYELPVVLAGDLNETPDGPVWQELARRLPDSGARSADAEPTFPAVDPQRRLDAVFAGPGVRVVDTRVIGSEQVGAGVVEAASDHRPVLADLLVG